MSAASAPFDYRAERFMQMAVADNKPGTVIQGLNLILTLQDPKQMGVLLAAIMKNRPTTNRQLETLNFVHSARFLPTPDDSALQVITVFDGEMDTYIDEFVATIGDTFDLIMSFVLDSTQAPTLLPVRDHPAAFVQFVKDNNRVHVNGNPTPFWPVFSAYPQKTVLDVANLDKLPAASFVDSASHYVDEQDVQGNILRSNGAKMARYFALQITDATKAKSFLRCITDGSDTNIPQVTPESLSGKRDRDHYLSVGVTFAGMHALGVAPDVMEAFPAAYQQGPACPQRAAGNGDIGDSDPKRWELGSPKQQIHLFVSLFANDATTLSAQSVAFTTQTNQTGLDLVWQRDSSVLPGATEHFGYRDGIAQPRIAGVKNDRNKEDFQPKTDVGEFLLGTEYKNAYGAKSIGIIPSPFGQNGSFAAIRVMEQDVEGFNDFLKREAARHRESEEFIAAKVMGRWRDGCPLSLTEKPGTNAADIKPGDINRFDFASSEQHQAQADHEGLMCPVGSHIRRMNPRSAPAVGKPYSRRLMRRGMPYEWRDDATGVSTRGLFGVFICSDLERQYEFLLAHWANGDLAARGTRGMQDPIIGAQNTEKIGKPTYRVPMKDKPDLELSIARYVHTRGSLYVFMPAISTLRLIAGCSNSESSEQKPKPAPTRFELMTSGDALDASYFDVKDPEFQKDPYKFYQAFRDRGPVQWIRQHKSYWVFSSSLIEQVTGKTDLFLKEPTSVNWVRGLFFMDPPEHTELRAQLDPIFSRIMAGSAMETAQQVIRAAIDDLKNGDTNADLVPTFTHRVPYQTFMALLGANAKLSVTFDQLINQMFRTRDRANPANIRVDAFKSGAFIEHIIIDYIKAGGTFPEGSLMFEMQRLQQAGQANYGQFVQTALHMLMGGYLSTQFLITTGIYNYLLHCGPTPSSSRPFNGLTPNAIDEMLRFDAPFQMADRYAAQDTELGGVPIKKDSLIVAVYGSANREAGRYKEPDKFDVDRTELATNPAMTDLSTHHSFGGQDNIHRCIGEHLAKHVAGTAISELFREFQSVRLKNGGRDPDYQPDPYFRSLNSLPVILR